MQKYERTDWMTLGGQSLRTSSIWGDGKEGKNGPFPFIYAGEERNKSGKKRTMTKG